MFWGFAWFFWLVPLFLFLAITRRWRWGMGYGCGRRVARTMARGEPDNQGSYIEELERRIADLEEKLDFTERLVSERREGRATS